ESTEATGAPSGRRRARRHPAPAPRGDRARASPSGHYRRSGGGEEPESRQEAREVGTESDSDAPGRGCGEQAEPTTVSRRARIERAPEENRAECRERGEERVGVGHPAIRPERDGGEDEKRRDPSRALAVEARREEIDQSDRRRTGERAHDGHRAIRVMRRKV